jgi:uroporphyrin-III C-methyltransferase/precorrin-2 dehydrogenase/sirohydrochlorin ferrochelatase
VNVVDDQPLCSFIFRRSLTVHRCWWRSPLAERPVLRACCGKKSALLPTSLGRMAEKASYWRNHLKTRLTSVAGAPSLWERVFRGRFASLMHAGNEAAQQILEDELDNPGSGGEIILVGAGPGDAGLLTLRGLQVLQDADVVFYDHLVSDGVRELIRRDAEQICGQTRR